MTSPILPYPLWNLMVRFALILPFLFLAACRSEASTLYLGVANDASENPSTAETNDAPSPDGALIRFVDVGPGLCIVGRFPGGQDYLYDAGHWVGSNCLNSVREIVQDGVIELVVISHSDSDHLGELDEILTEFDASMILHTGYVRDTNTWRNAEVVIQAQEARGATIINLAETALSPGEVFGLGAAEAIFVAGWHNWDDALSHQEPSLSAAELRNVISIVMRFDFAGRSLLLTGDTIGRQLDDEAHACRDAQSIMVARHAVVSLDADILLSSHHGGDNGDATCFIEAVTPADVIISAGHAHRHPRGSTIARYQAFGLTNAHIFRTDRGDDEGPDEWAHGRIDGCSDSRGDDSIELFIPADPQEPYSISYLSPQADC